MYSPGLKYHETCHETLACVAGRRKGSMLHPLHAHDRQPISYPLTPSFPTMFSIASVLRFQVWNYKDRGKESSSKCVCLCVCSEVRRQYPHRFLPTIFISSNCQPEHIVDGLAAGAQDYMTKPVNKQELVARIHAQLQQRTRVRDPSFMPCASAVLTCQS